MQSKALFAVSLLGTVFLVLAAALAGCASSTPTPVPTPTVAAVATPTPAPATVAAPTATPTQAPAIVLKATGHNPEPSTDNQSMKWFGDRVTQLTGGQVTFNYYFGGALAKAGEEMDAIKNDVADLGVLGFPFHPADLPMNNFFYSVPFGPSDPVQYAGIVTKIYAQVPALTDEISKQNQKLLYPLVSDEYDINTKKPVKTLSDLKGLKIAAIGTYLPVWAAAAGANATSTAMADRFTALQTGVIDGQLLPLSYIHDDKFYEMAPNVTDAGLGCVAWAAITINTDVWNRLPANVQKAMQQAAGEAVNRDANNMKTNEASWISDMKAQGTSFYTFSTQDMKDWANLIPDSPAVWAKAATDKGLPGWQTWNQFKTLADQAGYQFPRQFGIQQ